MIALGFKDMSTLVGHLPEKGRKELEEIVEEMKERDREERGTGIVSDILRGMETLKGGNSIKIVYDLF